MKGLRQENRVLNFLIEQRNHDISILEQRNIELQK